MGLASGPRAQHLLPQRALGLCFDRQRPGGDHRRGRSRSSRVAGAACRQAHAQCHRYYPHRPGRGGGGRGCHRRGEHVQGTGDRSCHPEAVSGQRDGGAFRARHQAARSSRSLRIVCYSADTDCRYGGCGHSPGCSRIHVMRSQSGRCRLVRVQGPRVWSGIWRATCPRSWTTATSRLRSWWAGPIVLVKAPLQVELAADKIRAKRDGIGIASQRGVCIMTAVNQFASITPQTPERSQQQRMEALRRANDIRSERARIKDRLRSGELAITDVLIDPPGVCPHGEGARPSAGCAQVRPGQGQPPPRTVPHQSGQDRQRSDAAAAQRTARHAGRLNLCLSGNGHRSAHRHLRSLWGRQRYRHQRGHGARACVEAVGVGDHTRTSGGRTRGPGILLLDQGAVRQVGRGREVP